MFFHVFSKSNTYNHYMYTFTHHYTNTKSRRKQVHQIHVGDENPLWMLHWWSRTKSHRPKKKAHLIDSTRKTDVANPQHKQQVYHNHESTKSTKLWFCRFRAGNLNIQQNPWNRMYDTLGKTLSSKPPTQKNDTWNGFMETLWNCLEAKTR